MADPIGELKVDPNLVVDAGKIYAKLHLAGKSQVQGFLCINSGMKDVSNGDTPENPGKSTFDFNNKSGEYEVCLISDKPTEILLPIDIQKDKAIQDIKKKIAAIKEGDKTQLYADLQARYIALKVLKTDTDEVLDKEQLSEEDLEKALEWTNKQREELKKNPDKELAKEAVKMFDAYFKQFAGDEYKSLSADSLMPFKFSEDIKDVKSVKINDFKIDPMDENGKKKLSDAFYKDLTKPVKFKLGYKVKFTIEKE